MTKSSVAGPSNPEGADYALPVLSQESQSQLSPVSPQGKTYTIAELRELAQQFGRDRS